MSQAACESDRLAPSAVHPVVPVRSAETDSVTDVDEESGQRGPALEPGGSAGLATRTRVVDPRDLLEDEPARRVREVRTGADLGYLMLLRGAGVLTLAVMILIGLFLFLRALEALSSAGTGFVTTAEWNPDNGRFGIAAVLLGTVSIGLTAIVAALPLALGMALFISEYAPARFKRTLVNLVDLMAAVPSIVYGLWGLFMLQPDLLVVGPTGEGLPRWLATYAGWLPLFRIEQDGVPVDPSDPLVPAQLFGSSTFVAGLVVALMVSPIACSVMRESFAQAPLNEREGAYALGATTWGMIRTVVLPFGIGGIIGGLMLGLGRALGETIAVVMVISLSFTVKARILEAGTSSISSLIALKYGEASPLATSGLMAAGLALFVLTLLLNFTASIGIARSRSGAVSDA